MKWYAMKSAGRGQGLVADEDTGRNVAVAYDEKDALLLAGGPALLSGLKDAMPLLYRLANRKRISEADVALAEAAYRVGCTAINQAEG